MHRPGQASAGGSLPSGDRGGSAGTLTWGVNPSADAGSGGGGGTDRQRLSGCCTLANCPSRVEAQKKSSVLPAPCNAPQLEATATTKQGNGFVFF